MEMDARDVTDSGGVVTGAGPRRPRRQAGIVALVGALALAACTWSLAVAAPRVAGARAASRAPARHGPATAVAAGAGATMIMYEGPLEMEMLQLTGQAPTWSEISRVSAVLGAARQATARYRDLKVAQADGYYTLPYLYIDGQGYHYVNDQYYAEAESGQFDPTHPPVLVYTRANGRMVLAGVMYIMPNSATPRQLAAIFPASLASWHRHINVCIMGGILRGKIVAIHDPVTCRTQGGHFAAHPFGWMVHAWIWQATRGTGLFDMDMGANTRATTLMTMGL